MYIAEPLIPDLVPASRSRVYFGLGENGQIKIGRTSRPSGRRGGEMHFTELCSLPGGKSVEDDYHQRYTRERIGRTEWFRLSDRLAFDLVVMCTQQGRVQSCEALKSIMLGRLKLSAAA